MPAMVSEPTSSSSVGGSPGSSQSLPVHVTAPRWDSSPSALVTVGRHDPHVLLVQPEQPAEVRLVLMGCLGGDPHRQASVLAELGSGGARLDRQGRDALADQPAADAHIA